MDDLAPEYSSCQDLRMPLADFIAWVRRQPPKTIFRARGWVDNSDDPASPPLRLVSAKISRSEFMKTGRDLAREGAYTVPCSIYEAPGYRCCYVGR